MLACSRFISLTLVPRYPQILDVSDIVPPHMGALLFLSRCSPIWTIGTYILQLAHPLPIDLGIPAGTLLRFFHRRPAEWTVHPMPELICRGWLRPR